MKLDFSALRDVAYRDCSNQAEREEQDRAVEQGFIAVDASECPFNGRHEWDVEKPAPTPETPSTGLTERLTSIDGKRDYIAMYQAVIDYHRRNSPVRLDDEYWQKTADDLSATAGHFKSDPFVVGLLAAVFDELEREYRALDNKK